MNAAVAQLYVPVHVIMSMLGMHIAIVWNKTILSTLLTAMLSCGIPFIIMAKILSNDDKI